MFVGTDITIFSLLLNIERLMMLRTWELNFFDLMEREVAIRWVNPRDPQYSTTHMMRQIDSAPTSNDDGELVYYRIFTESQAGLYSEGVVVDIVTSPLDLVDIEFDVRGNPGTVRLRTLGWLWVKKLRSGLEAYRFWEDGGNCCRLEY